MKSGNFENLQQESYQERDIERIAKSNELRGAKTYLFPLF